mmetsp:Transcript_20867/g.45222  ORF Transcript_20867/g.45222 Transcript_20867/m.45222 type:complete len:960 (+) Transcript_20867:86-2965(+)
MSQQQTETFSSEKTPGRCVGNENNDSMHFPQPQQQPVARPLANEPTQHRPRFARRNSMNAITPDEGGTGCGEARGCDGYKQEHGNAAELPTHSSRHPGGREGKPKKTSPSVVKSVARLCGPSRSKCGYCCGKRMHVLEVQDAYNENIIGEATTYAQNDKDKSIQTEKKKEQVDENKTSKSYGLLCENLSYGTYEDLINRGWRRSGKHLYRPHSFESCCPAISIRLDVLKFASRCNPQPPNASQSKVKESDLAKARILIRGSKSQRKVGKSVLRALESYNSKCVRGHSGECFTEEGTAFKELSSILSNDDSDQTSDVAKMQLDDGNSDSTGSGRHDKHTVTSYPSRDEGSCHFEAKRQHKKLRKISPDRDHDKMDNSSLEPKFQSNSPAKSKVATSSNGTTGQQKLLVNEEYLLPFLEKLSGTVYQVITKEAIKSAGSKLKDGTCGNDKQFEIPSWAWWNKDVEAADLPKWCSFKISQPRAGSKDQRSVNANAVSIMASTSACAAAFGRARGDIDKSLLVRSVVDSLKMLLFDGSSPKNDAPGVQVKVMEVSSHEKSGFVHVILDVSPSSVVAGVMPLSSTCSSFSKKSKPASNQRTSTKGVDEVDPIAEFMTRHQSIAHKLSNFTDDGCTQKKIPHQHRFLTVQSVPAHESSLQPEVHQLFCRYQTAIHGDFDPFFGIDEPKNGKDDAYDYTYFRQKNPQGFLDIDAAYGHLDEIRRSKIKHSYLTFYRFLVETPVAQDEVPSVANLSNEDGYDVHIPFGTYHQQYRFSTSQDTFDGPLIAVGVGDILPHCFSSVYAFYDPILSSSLELGKYTALREIEWVRRACQFRPELHYYYLGYYIHSCRKMSYKAEYKPSELLCPMNLKWVDFEVGKKRLEECSPIRHCCALYTDSPSLEKEPNDAKPKFRIEDIMLDIGEKEPHLVQVGMLNKQGREFIDPHVFEFVKEVGIDMCRSFIIKLR